MFTVLFLYRKFTVLLYRNFAVSLLRCLYDFPRVAAHATSAAWPRAAAFALKYGNQPSSIKRERSNPSCANGL